MCDHKHIKHYQTGDMHFSPVYGPWDDIHYEAICEDCGHWWDEDLGDAPEGTPDQEQDEYEEIPI